MLNKSQIGQISRISNMDEIIILFYEKWFWPHIPSYESSFCEYSNEWANNQSTKKENMNSYYINRFEILRWDFVIFTFFKTFWSHFPSYESSFCKHPIEWANKQSTKKQIWTPITYFKYIYLRFWEDILWFWLDSAFGRFFFCVTFVSI